MVEASDTNFGFNMNPMDDKWETSALWSWIQQALVYFRLRLRQAKSGGLGCLVEGSQGLPETKKAACWNKPLFENS